MPEFQDREEYEKWKEQRPGDLMKKEAEASSCDGEECSGEQTAEGGRGADHRSSEGMNSSEDLADPGELFKRAWDIYKRRAGVVISLYILSFLFFAGVFCLCLGSGYLVSLIFHAGRKVLPAAGAVMGIIAGIVVFTWGLAAVTYAVTDEDLGIRQALGKGRSVIWPFMWLISLVGYIIPGGFLLFIVPGIIFSVWFAFAQFVFVTEGVGGMNSLLKSKEYVRGRWFEVFLRLFLIWIASVLISSIPLLGTILSFLFVPYLLVFIWLLYDDLKALKGEVKYSSATIEKVKWIGAATLGYLALPLFIICLMGASIMVLPFTLLKGFLGLGH